MHKFCTMFLLLSVSFFLASAQQVETVYLYKSDSTKNMYVAVWPPDGVVNSFMFLLDGFGNSPRDILVQTDLPRQAARQHVLTIMPILATGPLYFGSDTASQQSLKAMVELVVKKYGLQGKDFYMGGFSIGGTCVVKYAELAKQHHYPLQPTALFALDPPLDWERYYKAAKRVVRLSKPGQVNEEVTYMLNRIEQEMGGTPEIALNNYYKYSPYSFSDSSQRAIQSLINTPLMIVSEPDLNWWLTNRGYDCTFLNITDHTAMINELQKLGNKKAVLVCTGNKGYRQPGHRRHPHSWSIADPVKTVQWLLSQQ